jgi:hypothetical protein
LLAPTLRLGVFQIFPSALLQKVTSAQREERLSQLLKKYLNETNQMHLQAERLGLMALI